MASPAVGYDRPKRPFYKSVDGFLIPGTFDEDNFRSALAYKPTPDDLFIVTYPKCGTTWVQNIVGCIFRQGKTFESGIDFLLNSPFLELTGAKAAEIMQRPGAIKLHLPFDLTPWSPEAKYIYVARNPKDACVSFYHHTENLPIYRFAGGSFDDYFELFIEGQTDFGDYFDHLLGWYHRRNDPNVLFITYERLKRETRQTILQIAEFIDPKYSAALQNDEQYFQDVLHHSSFKFMKDEMTDKLSNFKPSDTDKLDDSDLSVMTKKLVASLRFQENPQKNQFFRKGVVGDWKTYFSPMQNARMMKKFREKTMGTDIPDLWKDDM